MLYFYWLDEKDVRSMGSLSPLMVTADEEKAQYQRAMRMFKTIDQKVNKVSVSPENNNSELNAFLGGAPKDTEKGLALLPSTGE